MPAAISISSFAFVISIRIASHTMKTAKPKTKTVRLHEDVQFRGTKPRVDREAGVIHSVKLVGLTSSNGRRYTPQALKEAVRLYVGKPVNINHPKDPDDQRDAEDRFGILRNVQFRGDGLYGDIVYLKSHPMAERICEAVERPELAKNLMGCSHNSDGEVEMIGGESVVTKITDCRSVDIVADPATTSGFLESVQRKNRKRKTTMRMTLKEWFDRAKLLKPVRRTIAKLMEAGYMDPDSEGPAMEAEGGDDVEDTAGAMPSNDPADDPEAALRSGFRAAVMACVDDTTMSAKDKLVRLKKLLTVAEDLLSSGQEIPEEEEPVEDDEMMEEDEEKCGPDGKPMMENEDDEEEMMEAEGSATDVYPGKSKNPVVAKAKKVPESKQGLRREVIYLRREKRSSDLCREHGVKPTAALLEAMAKLGTDAKRLALIEPLKSPRRARTTSSYVGEGRTSNNGELTAEDFAKSILVG